MTTKNHHRCEIEIAASILSSVNSNPKRKTLIMNAVNLNHSVLEKHLTRLLGVGFLCKVNDSYQLTAEGVAFVEEFERFRTIEEKLFKNDNTVE